MYIVYVVSGLSLLQSNLRLCWEASTSPFSLVFFSEIRIHMNSLVRSTIAQKSVFQRGLVLHLRYPL